MGTSGESMDSSKINFNDDLPNVQEKETSYNLIFDNDVVTQEEFNKDINSTSNSNHNKTSSTVIEFLNDQETPSQLIPDLQVGNDDANSSIDDPNLVVNSSEISNKESKSNGPLTSESVNGSQETELQNFDDKLNESDKSEIEPSDFMANSINFAKNSQLESLNDKSKSKSESTSISVESVALNNQESVGENGIDEELQGSDHHLSNGNNSGLNASDGVENIDKLDASSVKFAEKSIESVSKETMKNTTSSDLFIKEESIHETDKFSHSSIIVEQSSISREVSSKIESALQSNSYIVTDNAPVIVKSDVSLIEPNEVEKEVHAQPQLSDHSEIDAKPQIIVQSDLAPSSNSSGNLENEPSKDSHSDSLKKGGPENDKKLSSISAEPPKGNIEISSSVTSEASSHYSKLENSNGSLAEEDIVPVQEEIAKSIETSATIINEKSPFLLLGDSTPIDISNSYICEKPNNESNSEPAVAPVSTNILPTNTLPSKEIEVKTDKDIVKPSVTSDDISTSTPSTSVLKEKAPEDTLNSSTYHSLNGNMEPVKTSEPASVIQETDRITDVFSNGLLMKEIIKYGDMSGERALNGQLATISYTTVVTESNVEVESVEKMKIVIGECDVVLGLDCSLALMYPGEKAKISMNTRYAYREFRWEVGKGVSIPPNSHLTYTLEIISVEPFPQPTPQNIPFILSLCEAKKALGNKFFNIKDYIFASLVYQKAIDHTEGIPEFLTLNSILKNNLAFCYFTTKDFNQAVPILQSVLHQDPYNIKAALRLVECFEVNARVEEALQIIETISVRHPNNTIIMKAQIRILEKIKENRVKLTQMYKKMFTTLSGDESAPLQEVVEPAVPSPSQPSFSWWKFGLSTLTISLCAFAALAYLKK